MKSSQKRLIVALCFFLGSGDRTPDLPAGMWLLTIPFLWPEHEQPWDSQCFTGFGLTQRLKAVGFELVLLHRTNPGLSTLFQLGIEWLESLNRAAFAGSTPLGCVRGCLSVARPQRASLHRAQSDGGPLPLLAPAPAALRAHGAFPGSCRHGP